MNANQKTSNQINRGILFECQKWHVRQAAALRKESRYYRRNDRPDSASVYARQATRHEKFARALTGAVMGAVHEGEWEPRITRITRKGKRV